MTEQTPPEDRADLVPGVMRCAKCEFQLVRVTLAVNIGRAVAGNSKTEPCPNGCGPLWPVTWEQYARQCQDDAERMADRAIAAEKRATELETLLAQRHALTDEQIDAAIDAWFGNTLGSNKGYRNRMRRALVAAHGIGDPT